MNDINTLNGFFDSAVGEVGKVITPPQAGQFHNGNLIQFFSALRCNSYIKSNNYTFLPGFGYSLAHLKGSFNRATPSYLVKRHDYI